MREEHAIAALMWLEKATAGEEGRDWDDVFQARDYLRMALSKAPGGK